MALTPLPSSIGLDRGQTQDLPIVSRVLYRYTTAFATISSAFYVRIFCTKCWCQKITKLKRNYKAKHFSFVIFAPKYWQKSARKMLKKLTPAVDFLYLQCVDMILTAGDSD
jgi:hypothetical protein